MDSINKIQKRMEHISPGRHMGAPEFTGEFLTARVLAGKHRLWLGGVHNSSRTGSREHGVMVGSELWTLQ